jgi:hypothetical protein
MERRKKVIELVNISNKIKVIKRDTRRKSDRVPLDVVVEAETASSMSILKTNDISEDGISLESRVPYNVGTEMVMSFSVPEGEEGVITVAGKVTNTSLSEDGKSLKLGVKFIAGSENSKNELAKYAEKNIIDKWYVS